MVFRVSCGFSIPLNSLLKDWTFDGDLMPCIGHFWNLPPMPLHDPHTSVCHMFLDDIFIVSPYHCIYTCHHVMNILFILWDQIDHQISATRLHQMSTVHTRIMTFIDSFMPEVPMKHRCFPWFQVAKTKSPHEGFPLFGSSFIPSTGSRIFFWETGILEACRETSIDLYLGYYGRFPQIQN